MPTAIFTHPDCLLHHPRPGHVEQPERYNAVETALKEGGGAHLRWRDAPLADWSDISLAHGADFIEAIENAEHDRLAMASQVIALDPDTALGPHSLEAARGAAGAGISAVDALMGGEIDNAFCLVRPPGHHAEPDKAMGFCVFNSAVIAARYARQKYKASRIAIVDFDVHHGNGTQAAFWDDEDAFFASSHEWPQYPGSGLEQERGAYDNIHNVRLQSGADGQVFQRAWGEVLLPALDDFSPDIVIISAGFDGHAADPLGGLALLEEDFAWVTREINAISRNACNGRVISFLEGGYDLAALGKSAAAHLKALASAP